MKKLSVAFLSAGLLALGAAAPAPARHQDPNCTVTVHPPVVGQAKVFVDCDHDHGN